MIDSHPTPPKLDAFTFALEPDALGGPVESPAGWHLVKVTDVRDAHYTDFEEEDTRTLTRRRLLKKHLDEIRQAPKVVLYCNDMRFTRMAEQLLLKSRVTGFSHLEGGLTAWREQGLPLETSLPESTAAPATGT